MTFCSTVARSTELSKQGAFADVSGIGILWRLGIEFMVLTKEIIHVLASDTPVLLNQR
jgi:hypothetical protein